ncbi:MAG: protein phosphatase 2C domain-containing protein, partial [Gemmatimonadetes bacterium]|nr:protein phosphatase 2C domain-containing protein [Gemmatimonadota bacterium]
LRGIDEGNRKVLADGRGAATTVAVAQIRGRRVRSIHVGDSGVVITGQRGRVKLMTVFHSPVGYAMEAGLLDEKEAIRHEERHLVSNLVGTEDMRIELGSAIELAVRDTVLVASDGLFDNFLPTEIVEKVRKGGLATVAGTLAREVHGRMEKEVAGQPSKPDDLSFLLFRPIAAAAPSA